MKERIFQGEFLSEGISELDKGAVIYKSATGCGATSLVLTNEENVLLFMPNIDPIMCKVCKYNPKGLYKYEMLAVYGDTEEDDILEYFNNCTINNKPLKVICCYDSVSKIYNFLLNFESIVVDEYQKLLTYSTMKSMSAGLWKESVYIKLLRFLEPYKHIVSFISSTKVDIKYLPKWVQGLEEISYIFPDTIAPQPILWRVSSVTSSLENEILTPLRVDGYLSIDEFKPVDKVIIFYSNVKQCMKLARGFNREDVRFICSGDKDTLVSSRRFKKWQYGEELTKITFVSSSGFCGLDLEDKTALTVVVSDYTKECSLITIEDDLIQAPGRMREKDNLNYGKYLFIYNTNKFELTEVEINEAIQRDEVRLLKDIAMTNELIVIANNPNSPFTVEDVQADALKRFDEAEVRGYIAINPITGLLELDELALERMRFMYETKKYYYNNGLRLVRKLAPEKGYVNVSTKRSMSYSHYVTYFRNNIQQDGSINWAFNFPDTELKTIIEKAFVYSKGKIYKNKQDAMKIITKVEGEQDILKLIKLELKPILLTGHELSQTYVLNEIKRVYDKYGILAKISRYTVQKFLDENQTVEYYRRGDGKRYIFIY